MEKLYVCLRMFWLLYASWLLGLTLIRWSWKAFAWGVRRNAKRESNAQLSDLVAAFDAGRLMINKLALLVVMKRVPFEDALRLANKHYGGIGITDLAREVKAARQRWIEPIVSAK